MPSSATFQLGATPLTLDALGQLARMHDPISLAPEAQVRIKKGHAFLMHMLNDVRKPIYGVNTGFGALCNTVIPAHQLEALQHNLLVSHAAGTGEEVPAEIVRLMLLLKAQSLSYGNSGVRPETVQRLVEMYNHDVLPVVYSQGSLGASGDLAPLAHLCLPLVGEGYVRWRDQTLPSKQLLQQLQWPALQLGPKEGLALLNGTQFMTAYGLHILLQLQHLMDWADALAALSLEAYDGLPEPFDARIHELKQHSGPRLVAAQVRKWLSGSQLTTHGKPWVQDPYSLRCVPQVHGAVRDCATWVQHTFEAEANSVSDNPNLFPDSEAVLSGGNFHGQPLALGLDALALAAGQLGGISERRVFLLMGGTRGLPAFLTQNPGLHSGLMIAQYTAAALVNDNAQMATPHSAYSVTSSNGQEDFVSMGANSAVRCQRIVTNLTTLLSVEWLSAAQALWLRQQATTTTGISPALQKLVAALHQTVSPFNGDRQVSTAISGARQLLLTTPVSGFLT